MIMGKNYFTDEQMEAIYAESIQVESDSYEGQFTLTQNQLKALMNLAVETAIMEADIEGLNERLAKFDEMNKQKPLNLDIKYDI